MTETLVKKVKKKKGFTLIELIIVVAIIAILAALAIPKLMGTQENAKKRADIANAKLIHDAAAKLLTEGKIGAGSFTIGNATASGDEKDVNDALQTRPVGSYGDQKGDSFVVTVTAATGTNDPEIKVTVGGVDVYPQPSSGVYSK